MPGRALALLLALFAALPAAAALAQGLTGDIDISGPIEISADSLEVLQDRRVAVFRGNVNAAQGELRLKAQELRVHYKSGGESEGGDIAGSISRIEASGGVLVSAPGETARARSGVYHVDRGEIALDGEVVLTRGENVIRGQSLVMNMQTGRSRIEGGGGQDGRVRGLFVPEGGAATPPAEPKN